MFWAIVSGCFASLASVFAKIASRIDTVQFDATFFIWKAFWVSLVVISNMIMWKTFTTALARSSNTLTVTVLNSATNMIFTGIFGLVLFSEKVTVKWAIGASLLILGSVVMTAEKKKKKDWVFNVLCTSWAWMIHLPLLLVLARADFPLIFVLTYRAYWSTPRPFCRIKWVRNQRPLYALEFEEHLVPILNLITFAIA